MQAHFIFSGIFIAPVVAHEEVLCIYPLSGAYAPLQRILFYLLLVFGVIARRQRWLVAGALASAMSYGGSAAIHSILLLTKTRSRNIDLDTYGVFAITSTGAMLTGPLLAWSTTLHSAERELRAIILLWGALVAIGAILSAASIYIKNSLPGPPCLPSIENFPSIASSLHNTAGNCSYACFPEPNPFLRSPNDVSAWKNRLDAPGEITGVFIPTIASTIPSAIITWIWVRRWVRSPPANQYLAQPTALKYFELGWVLDRLFQKRRRRRLSFTRVLSSNEQNGVHRHSRVWLALQYYAMFTSFGGFVVNIALNEVRFQSLPTNERYYEVGQWSPWVSVALVVLAQILNQSVKMFGEKDEREAVEMRNWEMRSQTSTFRSEFRRRNSL